jgi:SAM-dependent methyltransferase
VITGVIEHFRSFPGRALVTILDFLPQGKLESLLTGLMARRTARLQADEALRMLFRLDAQAYSLVGRYAVAYGGGLHTKHRHIRYHDYFVARCAPNERVLEVGCGNGALSHDIAQRSGCHVVGVDIEARKIAHARRQFPHQRLELRVADATRDDLHGRYDVIVLSNVLEHLVDRSGVLRRLTDTTGAERILIRVPMFDRDWRVPLKKELGVEWRLDLTHETEYTVETFNQEMEDAGLRIVHQEMRWGEIWAETAVNLSQRSKENATAD